MPKRKAPAFDTARLDDLWQPLELLFKEGPIEYKHASRNVGDVLALQRMQEGLLSLQVVNPHFNTMFANLEQVIFQMQLKKKIKLCRKRSALVDKKAAAKQQALVLFNVQQVIRRKRQRSSKEPWFQPFAIKPSVEQPRLASPTPITGRMDDDCEIVGVPQQF